MLASFVHLMLIVITSPSSPKEEKKKKKDPEMLFCLCVTLDRDAAARRPHSAHGDRSPSRFFFSSPEFTPRLDKTKAATPVMEPLFATAFG